MVVSERVVVMGKVTEFEMASPVSSSVIPVAKDCVGSPTRSAISSLMLEKMVSST
ncbi:MAG: hypothetical protein LRY51_11165 [Geovibrio sp.]|nr:hypothetical protein [Geovibrio sp.]